MPANKVQLDSNLSYPRHRLSRPGGLYMTEINASENDSFLRQPLAVISNIERDLGPPWHLLLGDLVMSPTSLSGCLPQQGDGVRFKSQVHFFANSGTLMLVAGAIHEHHHQNADIDHHPDFFALGHDEHNSPGDILIGTARIVCPAERYFLGIDIHPTASCSLQT